MSYQEDKCKNFSKYCGEGKIALVKKWMDNPNVDINWHKHGPMRQAIRYNQFEVVELLLSNPKIRTDYENDKKPLNGSAKAANGEYVSGVLNPFTMAIIGKNFTVLDMFIKDNPARFVVKRKEHLDILVGMKDEELNAYFREIPGFIDYVLEIGGDSLNILPPDAKDVFLF